MEIFIDGAFLFDIPHGGARSDVGNAFPEIENAALSGYASAVNYNNLSSGGHELIVRATDSFGSTIERTIDFEVVRFEKSFISAADDFELGWAGLRSLGKSVNIYGAIIDGEQCRVERFQGPTQLKIIGGALQPDTSMAHQYSKLRDHSNSEVDTTLNPATHVVRSQLTGSVIPHTSLPRVTWLSPY